ncbi:MAG: family 16 glycoside hydrolase [Pirellulales bacterium]
MVDRHITVVLNGVKVIDNLPAAGPTGGAIHTDPTTPGPLFLQGDHTSVQYRNIYLSPVIKD